MNERIAQLHDQCIVRETRGTNAFNSYMVDRFDSEKFAELIVRECCLALNPMLRDMISRGQGVDLIKQHFGMNPNEITTAMLDTAIAQCEQELAKKKHFGVE